MSLLTVNTTLLFLSVFRCKKCFVVFIMIDNHQNDENFVEFFTCKSWTLYDFFNYDFWKMDAKDAKKIFVSGSDVKTIIRFFWVIKN